MPQAEKDEAVKAHNDLRRRIAKGLETRGTPGSGPQPAAQDMNELVWDDELAAVAQRFVSCSDLLADFVLVAGKRPCNR